MGRANTTVRMRFIWFLCFSCLTTSAFAQPANAAKEALREQLQMLALLPQQQGGLSTLRVQPDRAVSTTSLSEAELQQTLSQFWLTHGVNVSDSHQLLTDDFYRVNARVSQLLALNEQQSWLPIAPGGWLRPGDNHRDIPIIAQRLALLGDLTTAPTTEYDYSDDLADAVRQFQQRHGLKVDAVIGPETLYWLNVTPLQRATLLVKVYVEETALRYNLPAQYVLVNVPAYELEFVDDGQLVLQSKVVVGLPYRQTPTLQSEITSVVLNPSWHVPRNIVRRNILPHIRKDGNYLEQQAYDVYDLQGQQVPLADVDWSEQAHGRFPYRLVQRPGEHNALGRYKFHFANSFDVYLHDTPEKSLFAKSQRAFSSGCVRVEKAAELAQWLGEHVVADERKWQQMQYDYTTTQWFKLRQRIPVYIVYWTAWVNEQGIAQFRPDIYNKESMATLAYHTETHGD